VIALVVEAVFMNAGIERDVARLGTERARCRYVVFPLALPPANIFERFASTLMASLKGHLESPPVMAAFHPELVGDRDNAHRLIGLLASIARSFRAVHPRGKSRRRHGVRHVFDDEGNAAEDATADRSEQTFKRLRGAKLDELLAIVADIRAERDRRYAPYASGWDTNKK
jgi:hypothetical protein